MNIFDYRNPIIKYRLLKYLWGTDNIYHFFDWLNKKINSKNNQQSKINGKIISIGNITIGGSGKTFLLDKLISYFEQDNKILIISRGYKRKQHDDVYINFTGNLSNNKKFYISVLGDEMYMIKQNHETIHLFVSKNKNRYIDNISNDYDYIFIDDGLQSYYLYRDIDIVCLNAIQLLNEDIILIPRGIYRNKLNDIRNKNIILMYSNLIEKSQIDKWLDNDLYEIKNNMILGEIFLCHFDQSGEILIPENTIPGKNIFLITGLGYSKSLEKLIETYYADKNITSIRLADHTDDIDKYIKKYVNNKTDSTIMMTQKDFVKVSDETKNDYNICVIESELQLKDIDGNLVELNEYIMKNLNITTKTLRTQRTW